MACSAAKRKKICDQIGDSLLVLVETACSAEAEILRGSPDARTLMTLVAAASEGIGQLAPAFDILEYAPVPSVPRICTKTSPTIRQPLIAHSIVSPATESSTPAPRQRRSDS